MVTFVKLIIGIFLTLWIISTAHKFLSGSSSSTNESEQIVQENQELVANNQDRPMVEDSVTMDNWQYDESIDGMRGENSYFAINKSFNTIELSFPYGAGVDLSMILRDDAQYGKDILFAVNKGQLFCAYQDCYISVKFDDGSIQKLATNEAEAGSSEVLFLANDISGFVEKLKTSENLIVEVNFYDHGNEQFQFNVSGLDWSRF